MKKIFWILCWCILSTCYTYAQNDYPQGDNNDDVYYNDDNGNPPAPDYSQNQAAQDNSTPGADNGSGVTYQQFYDQLSPYGNWVNYPGYGNCWVPNQAPAGFDPYVTGGHWVYTEYGWTWVSDYDWGWGPFHYGRWFDDPSYGWLWIPGYDWAPAWVVWGDYGGYYCWAPIGPGAVITAHYRPDARFWHFIPHENILAAHLGEHMVRPEVAFHGNTGELNSHITVITHAGTYGQSVFFAGPKAHEVEGFTHTKVERIGVTNVSHATATKVVNNQVNIYRPAIQRTDRQPAPKNVKNVTVQPAQHNEPAQRSQPAQRIEPAQRTEPARQTWTPPRQSAPVQPQQRQQPAHETNFIPSRPAPEQHFSAPVQHFSAPAPAQHFSAPSAAPRGGGGGRR